ncbi:MAG: citramalate synthase, partial [Isosphaeraceae bacterium]
MTRISIYDTTLRDGSQGEGVNFSLQDKLLITRRLDAAGFDYIEGGYPLSNPKDAAYFGAVRDIELKHARVAAFGMTRRRDVAADDDHGMKALVAAGTAVITIVGKSWDLHVQEVLGASLEENLRMIADSVGFCAASANEVIYDAEHFFDGYKRNPDYALRTLQAAAAAGAAWIVLCDTNGGSLPEEIAAAVSIVGREIHVPLGIHTHNDGDLAVANALTAVQHGARQVQGTVNGLGERCGNVDLCSVLGNLALKYPEFEVLSPGKLEHLTELSRYVYETANMNFRPNQPFVGASAFAHKGGMHVHGVRKNATTYEHVIPAAVGNERRVLISELSGKSSVALKLEEYGLEQDGSFHALVLDRVQELENEGYQFEASDGSFVLLVERLAKRHRAWFEP